MKFARIVSCLGLAALLAVACGDSNDGGGIPPGAGGSGGEEGPEPFSDPWCRELCMDEFLSEACEVRLNWTQAQCLQTCRNMDDNRLACGRYLCGAEGRCTYEPSCVDMCMHRYQECGVRMRAGRYLNVEECKALCTLGVLAEDEIACTMEAECVSGSRNNFDLISACSLH